MKDNNLLYRSLTTEYVVDNEARSIHGLAIPTNVRSAYIRDWAGEYYEVILPEAVNESIIKNNDIKLYLNHDSSQGTFARSKYGEGTLNLTITERGLEFDFVVPDTVFGNALLEGIKRGDYDAVSFCYRPSEYTKEFGLDGRETHYIRGFQIIDEISILSCTPAFSETEVGVRSAVDYMNDEDKALYDSLVKIDDVSKAFDSLFDKYLDIVFDINN